jgi:hypothetical protein
VQLAYTRPCVASVALRCALVVFALIAGAWLAVGLRVVALEEQGEKAVESARHKQLDRDEIQRARDGLESAKSLTADPAPELIEGRLLGVAGRRDEAGLLAIRVVAQEPENADAWYLAHVLTTEPQGLAVTRRRLQELNPLLADQLR